MAAAAGAAPHVVAACAGGISTALSLAAFYPLHAATVRQQAKRVSSSTVGILQTLLLLSREDGALYRGLGSVLAATASRSAVFYFWLAKFRKSSNRVWRSPSAELWNAMRAGAVTALCVHPLIRVSTLMAGEGGRKRRHRGTMDAVAHILHCEGATGLYAGVAPAVVLAINPAILFCAYAALRRTVVGVDAEAPRTLSPAMRFVCGGAAKLIATIVTYPLQTMMVRRAKSVRSVLAAPRQRHEGNNDATSNAAAKALGAGTSSSSAEPSARSGTTAADLYRGLSAKLVQTTLTTAMGFCLRDMLERALQRAASAVPGRYP